MARDENQPRKRGRSEVRHSIRFGDTCKMRACFHQRAVGTKMRKPKGKNTEPVEETVYENFWCQTPVGYLMPALRKKMKAAAMSVSRSNRASAVAELDLARFPQVATVMGEINAMLPKTQRLRGAWTNDDEENTLFVIEKAA